MGQVIYSLDPYMQGPGMDGDWEWHSPKEAPFRVAGLPWFSKDRIYRRLPKNPAVPIPPAVDELADCTAGVQIHFQTNSRRIGVRVRLNSAPEMHHMAGTGEGGIDIYVGAPFKQRSMGAANFNPRERNYQALLMEFPDETAVRNITINLPLYKGVMDLEIGLVPGCDIMAPPPYACSERIVVYGTSITQGGCASRPGMAYTNILSRRFNQEFINLGFSGNGKGEPELAQIISTIPNMECVIIDYEANGVDTSTYKKTLPQFIKIIRDAHPKLPILLVSRIPFAKHLHVKHEHAGWLERLEFQKDLVGELRQAGDEHLHFLCGQDLLGEDNWDECTVDGVHPNDLGFYRMAGSLESILRTILKSC